MKKKIKKAIVPDKPIIKKNKKMQTPLVHKENPTDGNTGKNNAGGYE